jgi:dolichol kinase
MPTASSPGRVQPLRKLIHLAGATFPLLYLFTTRQAVLVVTAVALVLVLAVEWGRQQWPPLERLFEWLIGPAMRQGEESNPTAGTWSMLGLFVTVLVVERALAIPAMFYAQLGDPAAEIVGRRWGRHRLPSGKSLEGSLGCFGVSLLVGLACSQLLPVSPGLVAVGALTATVVEVAPLPPGDNLLMAPASGLTMALVSLVTT